MNASAFDAAAHAGAAFLGVAGAHAAADSIPALNLRQLAAVFLIAFGRAILAYPEGHPVCSAGFSLSPAAPQTETLPDGLKPGLPAPAGEPPALQSPQSAAGNPPPPQ